MVFKSGTKIRIRVNDLIQADYGDLKKKFYKGKILGRKRKDGPIDLTAFRVKLVGDPRERVFFEDELEICS